MFEVVVPLHDVRQEVSFIKVEATHRPIEVLHESILDQTKENETLAAASTVMMPQYYVECKSCKVDLSDGLIDETDLLFEE